MDQLKGARENLSFLGEHGYPEINSDTIYGLLVIGMKSDLEPEARRSLEVLKSHSKKEYEVKTFNEILEENQTLLRNLKPK